MSPRRGDWIRTYTGRAFWPLDARPEDLDIVDIAHSLSMQCRFTGHVRQFYSVAEHSIRVACLMPPAGMLEGLLHDATEAYLVDVPRPVKRLELMDGYRDAERKLHVVIAHRFGIPSVVSAAVKTADDVLLATEARDLMGVDDWPLPPPLRRTIVPWTPAEAEARFLELFETLQEARR